MAETLQPDLILLDLNLPKMDGFEVAEQIPRLAPHARVLFMSEESSPYIVRRALDLGAHGYIQKRSADTDLLPGIYAVLAGQRFVSRSLAFTEPAAAPAPRRHEILFCSDDAAIIDGFARFIAAALHAADAAIALVTESHRTLLLQELRTQGWTLTAPSSAAPAFHLTLTSHLTPSDFSRRSTVCVRPPPKPGKHVPASLFAGNVRDAVGRRQNGGGGSARTILWRTGARRRHSVRVSDAVHERRSGAHAHLRGAHRRFGQLAAGTNTRRA